MYPHERSLVKDLKDEPFALIGVNSDNDREELKKIVAEENITWRNFYDDSGDPEIPNTQGPIATAWNVSGWPTIYVLDAQGRIRYKNVRGEELDQAIHSLIAEAKGEAGEKSSEAR